MNIWATLCMSMFDIRCRCYKFRSFSLLSPIVLQHGVFNPLIPDATFSTSVDPMGEVAPKISNWLILGKKSVSTKFQAAIMPSDGSSKVKSGLPSTIFLVLMRLVFSQTPYIIFFPKIYTIVSILNENVLLHLSFSFDIFLIKSSQ